MGRYNDTRIVRNNSEYYEPLRKGRNEKQIRQYVTPVLNNPGRATLKKDVHLWKYGDRLYKLAHQYYGDVNFWWVIAWYNGYPTEAHIAVGSRLSIPLDLSAALKVLRG
jgi:nucleoid-associated protein YgaU